MLRLRLGLLALLSLPLGLTACSKASPDDGSVTRTTTTTRETSVAGIVSTRSETTTTETIKRPEAAEAAQRQRGGNLTAGDYDDLLNPEQYADYAGDFLQRHREELPFVDTRTRIQIKARDAKGRPVPFARVDIARPGGALRLVTVADGTAFFYPKFDQISGRARISIQSSAGSASRVLSIGGSSPRSIEVSLPGIASSVQAMDLVLVLDTTGSMGDEMTYLQAELDGIVARLKREAGNLDLRIGLILYRDEGDEYVVQSIPLTERVSTIRSTLAQQTADGGGDTPEAMDQAMSAAGRMQWRPDAAKALLLVADAPPHRRAVLATLDASQRLRSRGVQIVPVAASETDDVAQYIMRTMSALTQGRYIFLTDDSGIGNPHDEPDIACFVVTRLDQLIARVLAGIAQGRRIEPAPGEVIRTVGNYDRGRCRGASHSGQQQ